MLVAFDQANYVKGFKLFDIDNNCLLSIGDFTRQTKEILLEAEDRIVGFRSRLHYDNQALHDSLVVVIARRS